MYTSFLFVLFIAFYLCYNASPKVKTAGNTQVWQQLRKQKKMSRLLAAGLSLSVLGLLLYRHGAGSGSFAFVAMLMSVGSMVVLLAPFGYLKWFHIAGLYLFLLIMEKFIF